MSKASPRKLPVLSPLRPIDLARFDTTENLPALLPSLQSEFGTAGITKLIARLLYRGALLDPLRALPPAKERDEVLTRQQLRPVLLLEDVLLHDFHWEPSRVQPFLRSLVLASGDRFLSWFVPPMQREDWLSATPEERAAFARALTARMFNTQVGRIETSAQGLSFQVDSCRFVLLLQTLHRMHLAPLFCEVDERFAQGERGAAFVLERPTTIARGGACCAFCFRVRE